jgi:hypothetical protein
VIQASINWQPNGKPEFTAIKQTFIDINDATANVMLFKENGEISTCW